GIFRYLFTGSPAAARNILTTISAAMIGVAGVVFSITLVVLTLASTQFGPQLVRNFMYVRLNQIVLGAYISTYVYCLIVLNVVIEVESYSFVPQLSILMALIATVFNIILLIIFIHHVAVSIQANYVVSSISRTLSKNIQTMFPEKIGKEDSETDEASAEKIKSAYKKDQILTAGDNGYIEYIDGDFILDFASEKDVLIEIYYRPGGHIVKNMRIGCIYSNELLSEDELDDLSGCFTLGETRTIQQDLEYAIHQMVEIAARALSTGVNDPYTAITCVDNLTSVLAYLSQVKFPSKYRLDDNGKLRLIADKFSYEGMLDAAFNQIRQFGKNNPPVIIKMMESMTILFEITDNENYRKVIRKHASMILNIAKKYFDDEHDLSDLEKRSRKIFG
ncbi:MAG TPA: DUF2254 domain-containing protein, partial [Ignavibacteria bacterium]|nr:DUF2254 domain-containing protein [Ignavibacteria bacterium]